MACELFRQTVISVSVKVITSFTALQAYERLIVYSV